MFQSALNLVNLKSLEISLTEMNSFSCVHNDTCTEVFIVALYEKGVNDLKAHW